MIRDKLKLDGRIAVVTGGARGIGYAISTALIELGARVCIADREEQAGRAAAAALGCAFVQLDVRDRHRVRAAAEEIAAQHGPVDILVNNAGIAYNSPAVDTSADEWLDVMDINVNGVWWCAQAFGRTMVERRHGSIVNIGSMSGIIANKPQPQAHYNASKAAVHMLTKSLAAEWAPFGVRVNAVAPGYIGTEMTKQGMANAEWKKMWLEMTPQARVGEPDDIAAMVAFLASDASAFTTGSIMSVDGGYTSW